jgi:hypothetical protein
LTTEVQVQKVPLTEQDLAYIKHLLDGGPKRETVQHLKEKGWNTDQWEKRRTKSSREHRECLVKKLYKLGECTVCRSLSEYKIIKKVPDASVISWYCEAHLPSELELT